MENDNNKMEIVLHDIMIPMRQEEKMKKKIKLIGKGKGKREKMGGGWWGGKRKLKESRKGIGEIETDW